jgi:hypothetical protein
MKILKYVINDTGLPIIFSMDNLHTDILTKVVAAGFVIIDYDWEKEFFFVKCYGGSSCLGISSRAEDTSIIEIHLNGCLYEEKSKGKNFDSVLN